MHTSAFLFSHSIRKTLTSVISITRVLSGSSLVAPRRVREARPASPQSTCAPGRTPIRGVLLTRGERRFPIHASASIHALYTGGTSGKHSGQKTGPRGRILPARGLYARGAGRGCQIGAAADLFSQGRQGLQGRE